MVLIHVNVHMHTNCEQECVSCDQALRINKQTDRCISATCTCNRAEHVSRGINLVAQFIYQYYCQTFSKVRLYLLERMFGGGGGGGGGWNLVLWVLKIKCMDVRYTKYQLFIPLTLHVIISV